MDCYHKRVNFINLTSKSPPFFNGGRGGISWESLKIPLNPPFTKGDFEATALKLMTLIRELQGGEPWRNKD